MSQNLLAMCQDIPIGEHVPDEICDSGSLTPVVFVFQGSHLLAASPRPYSTASSHDCEPDPAEPLRTSQDSTLGNLRAFNLILPSHDKPSIRS